MFRLMPFIPFLYVALRLVLPLRLTLPVKTILSAILFIAAFKQDFFIRYGGDFLSPELPTKVIEIYGAAFGALFFLFIFTILRDLFLIILGSARFFYPSIPQIGRSLSVAMALTVVAVALSAYGTYEAKKFPRVKETTVSLPRLPLEFEGFRIVQLSDIHISSTRGAEFAHELAQKVETLSPDIILITGDFIDGSVEQRGEAVSPLAALSAPYGVFGVLGNHEYYLNAKEWRKFIEEKLSIKILINEHVMVTRGQAGIAIAGVADTAAVRFSNDENPDVEKALVDIPKETPIIVLDHQPRSAVKNAAAGVSLQLSGHTHGGMVPLISSVVKKFNGGYLKGWYDVNGMKLYVSPGTGIWNGFMLRICDPAEITVMNLTAK